MATTESVRDAVHTALIADEIAAKRFNHADLVRARLHNQAVGQWAHSTSNLTVRDSERAILDLLAGIASWVGESENVDPFSREFIIEPMISAAHTALNYEFGRLMGGPLSSFLSSIAEQAEVTS